MNLTSSLWLSCVFKLAYTSVKNRGTYIDNQNMIKELKINGKISANKKRAKTIEFISNWTDFTTSHKNCPIRSFVESLCGTV